MGDWGGELTEVEDMALWSRGGTRRLGRLRSVRHCTTGREEGGNASEPKAKRTGQNIPSPAHRLEAGHMGERGGEGG